jgi:hypothetical protein
MVIFSNIYIYNSFFILCSDTYSLINLLTMNLYLLYTNIKDSEAENIESNSLNN